MALYCRLRSGRNGSSPVRTRQGSQIEPGTRKMLLGFGASQQRSKANKSFSLLEKTICTVCYFRSVFLDRLARFRFMYLNF